MFPGQGAQHVGMGVDIAAASPAAASVFERASVVLGLDLAAVCRDGPAEALVRTDLQQPAILAVGAAVVAALREVGALGGEPPAAYFGLSLGEFTALHAAGALELEDALTLVRERGLGMQEASEAAPSGLTALRCDPEKAETICAAARETTGGVCTLANLNAPGQVVISGDVPSLDAAEAKARELGVRRPQRLPVAGAFHSPLMRPGAERLSRALETIEVKVPEAPVISNVTGAPTRDPDVIRANLVAQVTSPVRFADCVQSAVDLGVRRFVETAPGRVLCGLVRRIGGGLPDVDLECLSADTAEAFAALGVAAGGTP